MKSRCTLSLLVAIVAGLRATALVSLNEIDYIFSFGDSYTADGSHKGSSYQHVTGLNATTTSGGFTWLHFLALKDPDTASNYFDLATGGASTSEALVQTGSNDFISQVDLFLESFGSHATPWTSDNTLMTLWFGINDVGYGYLNGHGYDFVDLLAKIQSAYDAQVRRLYAVGGRSFLVLNIPPIERAPLVQTYSSAIQKLFEDNVGLYNQNLDWYVGNFSKNYPGANATLIDIHELFETVLANPANYQFNDSTTVCPEYAKIMNITSPHLFLPECIYPLEGYFWHNLYHPSWPIHEQIAEKIFLQLGGLEETPVRRAWWQKSKVWLQSWGSSLPVILGKRWFSEPTED